MDSMRGDCDSERRRGREIEQEGDKKRKRGGGLFLSDQRSQPIRYPLARFLNQTRSRTRETPRSLNWGKNEKKKKLFHDRVQLLSSCCDVVVALSSHVLHSRARIRGQRGLHIQDTNRD